MVRLSLAVRNAAAVRVAVYDVRGRRVRMLQDGALAPGFYELSWDGSDGGHARVSAGVYFIRMESGGFRTARKIVLLPVGR
jgi:hypothetical protein